MADDPTGEQRARAKTDRRARWATEDAASADAKGEGSPDSVQQRSERLAGRSAELSAEASHLRPAPKPVPAAESPEDESARLEDEAEISRELDPG